MRTTLHMIIKAYSRVSLPFLPSALIVFVVAGYPIAGLLSAALDIPSRVTSIPFRTLITGIAFVLITTELFFKKDSWKKISCWEIFLCLWLALYSIRLITNVYEGYTGASFQLLFFFIAVMLPTLAIMCVKQQAINTFATGLNLIIVSTIISGGAIFGEYMQIFGKHSYMFTGRLSTDTVNPITLGHIATSLLLALIAIKIKFSRVWVLASFVSAAIGLACLSYADSRASFLALAGAILFFFVSQYKTELEDISRQMTALIIVVLAAVLLLYPLPYEGMLIKSYLHTQNLIEKNSQRKISYIKEKIRKNKLDRMKLNDASANIRLAYYKQAYKKFLEHPLTGASNWQANKTGHYPHNLFLEAFSNLGIFGGLGFLVLIASGFYFSWLQMRQAKYLYALLFIQAVISGMFSGSLFASAQLLVMLAILLKSQTIKNQFG